MKLGANLFAEGSAPCSGLLEFLRTANQWYLTKKETLKKETMNQAVKTRPISTFRNTKLRGTPGRQDQKDKYCGSCITLECAATLLDISVIS